jgi:hypothetical protein
MSGNWAQSKTIRNKNGGWAPDLGQFGFGSGSAHEGQDSSGG